MPLTAVSAIRTIAEVSVPRRKDLMAKMKKRLPAKYQIWVDARNRFRLSHRHIQMARELGMNPKKFGGLANHVQEPWKAPLPVFIEDLYFKRFRRMEPEKVLSIENLVKEKNRKREERKKRMESVPSETDMDPDDSPF